MLNSRQKKPRREWNALGVLVIGASYGLAQYLPQDLSFGFLYLQSPFFFTSLGGIAIAFACRPVLSRIQWTQATTLGLALSMLAGIGPLGEWAASWTMAQMRLAAFPLHLPESATPLLLSAVVASVFMAFFFQKPGGGIGARELWARVRLHPLPARAGRLALLATGALLLRLLAAWGDALLESGTAAFYFPLVEPNPWLRLEGLWQAGGDPGIGGNLGSALAYLALLWLRHLVAVAPLIPFALTIRGSWLQLTLVFGILLFVLGEFAPLMVNQPFPSLGWLVARTALGLAHAFAIAALTARLFGISPRLASARS